MDISNASENAVVTGTDGGRGIANLNYILFIVGFFVGFTALVGVILAYINLGAAEPVYKSHLRFQIKIFWRGVIFLISAGILYFVVAGIGLATFGIGLLLLVVPAGIGLWWLVWTIMAIAKGMGCLGRREPIPSPSHG